jgi:putative tryptophan/tyrosine transport system substrate-binding protein
MNPKLVWLITAILLALLNGAEAQQPKKIPRIGYLALNITTGTRVDAFRHGLRQLGYTEGKDIVIESRAASGRSPE